MIFDINIMSTKETDMSINRKYKSFGVRRANNLSDIDNPELALNNLLDNLTGVDPAAGITFISQDLDAIRGLKDTNVETDNFEQLQNTAPTATSPAAPGAEPSVISPLIRLEDRFRQYRSVSEDPPVFVSGLGPRAFFIPSSLLPTFGKTSKIEDELEANLLNSDVQTSDDFWMFGEFVIDDKLRIDFDDFKGGIVWEGYFLPNPSSSTHLFRYETSGLYHVEYKRFEEDNWTVLKSIYAKQRDVDVENAVVDSTVVTLQEGESKYVSVGDVLESVNGSSVSSNAIVGISGDTITLEESVTLNAGDTLTFDMSIGEEINSGEYLLNEIYDRAETPQTKMRFFWWFPVSESAELKYLRTTILGRGVFDYFFLNQTPASPVASSGSIREVLETAVTPSNSVFGGASENEYKKFTSTSSTQTVYIPKSSLSQIVKANINISFRQRTRSANGNFLASELGNVIVPTNVADFDTVISKNTQIKDLLGSNDASPIRLISKPWPETRSSYPVSIIDHNGLVDYFVASSSGNEVSVTSTSNLKSGMICITSSTSDDEFVTITEIISNTEFRTSRNLDLSNEYIFVYSNSGILDRSLEHFCSGVFGKVLAAPASAGSTTLTLKSVSGIEVDQVVQYDGSIPDQTKVTDINGLTITLSEEITQTINIGETIVFAPDGTTENKEICVLPLDLSPPFIGIDIGLDTNNKGIKSSLGTLNVRVSNIEMKNVIVTPVALSDRYDHLIPTSNNSLSIIAKKL